MINQLFREKSLSFSPVAKSNKTDKRHLPLPNSQTTIKGESTYNTTIGQSLYLAVLILYHLHRGQFVHKMNNDLVCKLRVKGPYTPNSADAFQRVGRYSLIRIQWDHTTVNIEKGVPLLTEWLT